MHISIIVPAYNAAKYLAPTLESAQSQTVTDWELIVVDDGSQDETATLARQFAAQDTRIHLVQQTNGGLAAARNAGIRAANPASATFIFLDSDDLWTPDALESLLGALEANPRDVAAHALSDYIDENGDPLRPGEYAARCRNRQAWVQDRLIAWPPEKPTTFSTLIAWNCIGNPGLVLMRRKALEAVGPFDARMNPSEDYDMWLRLSRLGDIAFVDKVILGYRRHSANMSGDERVMRAADLAVRSKALLSPENSADQSHMIDAAYRALQRHLSQDKMRHGWESLKRGELTTTAKQCVYSARHYARALRGLPRQSF
jgi:glycosyltransferase involved in cell wall biosynthesis